jgi:hypothetical protein
VCLSVCLSIGCWLPCLYACVCMSLPSVCLLVHRLLAAVSLRVCLSLPIWTYLSGLHLPASVCIYHCLFPGSD